MFGRLVAALGIDGAQQTFRAPVVARPRLVRRNGRYLTPSGARDVGRGGDASPAAILAVHGEALLTMPPLLLPCCCRTLVLKWCRAPGLDAEGWRNWRTPLVAADRRVVAAHGAGDDGGVLDGLSTARRRCATRSCLRCWAPHAGRDRARLAELGRLARGRRSAVDRQNDGLAGRRWSAPRVPSGVAPRRRAAAWPWPVCSSRLTQSLRVTTLVAVAMAEASARSTWRAGGC